MFLGCLEYTAALLILILGAAVVEGYLCSKLGESCMQPVVLQLRMQNALRNGKRATFICGCTVCLFLCTLCEFPHLRIFCAFRLFSFLCPDIFACLCKPTFLIISLHLLPSAQTTHDPAKRSSCCATIFSYLF